jgi:hypothetical protein
MAFHPAHGRLLLSALLLVAMSASQALAQSPFTMPPAPQPPPANLRAGEGAIVASARYGKDGAFINGGLHWRVYADKPDQAGGFRMLKEDYSPQPTFVLPAGNYIVHAAFGLASAAKPVQVGKDTAREVFDIPAGGLRIEGHVGNANLQGQPVRAG